MLLVTSSVACLPVVSVMLTSPVATPAPPLRSDSSVSAPTTWRCRSPLLTDVTAALEAMPSSWAVLVPSPLATIRLDLAPPVVSVSWRPLPAALTAAVMPTPAPLIALITSWSVWQEERSTEAVAPLRSVRLRVPNVPSPWPPLRLDRSTLFSPPMIRWPSITPPEAWPVSPSSWIAGEL